MSLGKQDKEEYDHAIQLQRDAPLAAGFLVVHVPFLSKANRVGLQPGDIITKYNGLPVTSASKYRAASDRNLADKTEITLTIVRAGNPIEIAVPPGLLGFDGKNWTPFIDTIIDL